MNLTFALAALLLLVHCTSSQENSWSWNEPEPDSQPQASEQDFVHAQEQDFRQNEGDEYVESSLPLNNTLTEQVVDEILSSTREGRALEGFQEVYSDPNIQDALQKGDDGEARNIIKDRLCSLGLVQCDEHVQGKRPYIAPEELVYAQPVAINPVGRPIPTIPLKGVRGGGGSYGPPKPVPFPSGPFPPGRYPPLSPPPGKFGPPKPPRRHFGPPPSKPYYGKPDVYETGIAGEYLSKPPPFPNGGSHPTLDSPYQFEYGTNQAAHHKDKRVEIHVNAQGGAASAAGGSTPGSVALEHVHHHYHHNLEGDKSPLNPLSAAAVSSSNSFGSSSSSFGSHPNSLGSSSGSFGSHSGSSSGSFGSHSGSSSGSFGSLGSSSGSFGSLGSGPSFADNTGGFSPVGATGLGSFSSGGLSTGVYGGQTLASYGNGGTFGSSKPVVENYAPQTFDSFGASVGSYGSSGLYKKELNVSPVNGNYLQSYADKYQGLESARAENYDCVCVPYDQCPTHDVIGRKDDLYLALDPRSLKSDIEASLDEEERVITDGNGTMSVVRVPKNVNGTEGGNEEKAEEKAEETEKKVSKREAKGAGKKNDAGSTEGRQFYGGQSGRPQACGPRHVCCRKPIRPQVPQVNGRQCGIRHSQGINGRIKNPVYVDGDSEFGEYPWQVAILKKDPKESVYVCGGTLVDPLHILTAAHCVKTYTGLDLRVRLGEWDVNHDVEFYPYIERDIASVNVHPEFYAGTLYNDIAVLRMDKPVDFAKHPHISPACLPYPRDDYTGTRCWTTGWGKDAFGDFGKYQNILKEVDVPVINDGVCQRQMQQTRLGYDFKLHPGFVCAGGEEGKDACKGDGGGPMVCERSGTWQVVGIVSWGIGCGQVGVPGVYVKVAHYLDWIRQVTQRY